VAAKRRTSDNSNGDNKGGKSDSDWGYKDDSDNGSDGDDGSNSDNSGNDYWETTPIGSDKQMTSRSVQDTRESKKEWY